jgi:hypothetical protein
MPSIESYFFVFVANFSPIDCPLSSINHPVLIAKKMAIGAITITCFEGMGEQISILHQEINANIFHLEMDVWIKYLYQQ